MQEMSDSTIQSESAENSDTVSSQHSVTFCEDDDSEVRNMLRETQTSVNSVSSSQSHKHKHSKFSIDEDLKAVQDVTLSVKEFY